MPFKLEDYSDDSEFKKFVDDTIAKATKPLEDTKDGLLKDIGKLKEATKQFDGVDLEALKQAAADLERINKEKHSKESDAEKALRLAKEQHQDEMKALRADVDTLKGTNKKLLVDDNLRANLVKANVNPVLIDAAMAIHKPSVSILSEEGKQVAKVGDLSISDHITAWAQTDEGKHFVMAPANKGGNSKGSGSFTENDAAKFFDRKNAEYSLTNQIKLKKSNPDLYNKLSKVA